MKAAEEFDYDWLVIGSGFGGSVSALRLAQKGYKVAVLECGRRFEDEDFAKTAWNLRRYIWMPRLGLKGVFRMTIFKDVFIGSGSGVGGGSLGYANTLYRGAAKFFIDTQWAGLEPDWERALAPHYDEAERMLGVVKYEGEGPADELLKGFADHVGVGDTFTTTNVGVFFGEPGKTVPDPYFGGEGPARTGCVRCGACIIGCRYGAKNTLVKNYLWFAERAGVEIQPERTVTDVRPIGAPDGSDGYAVSSVRSGAWARPKPSTLRARGVVLAAGALGTNRLLARCKLDGSLPRVSDRLGHLVRTNSESIVFATAPDDTRDFTKSVALTSSVYTDADTHIEVCTYGRGADAMSFLSTLLVDKGGRRTRPLRFLLALARRPLTALRMLWPVNWARRTMILVVMQTLDNAIRLKVKRRLPGGDVVLTTEQDPDNPLPAEGIPVAGQAARWVAEQIGGTARAMLTESILAIPTTAHILGGAAIGASADTGVVDAQHCVYGYENLLVCDGAAIPANVGVNPSLTITALAERAMTFVPAKKGDPAASVGAAPVT